MSESVSIPFKRQGISKGLRFKIFARDNFTCRYCGRQSDVVPLHVDHVIPVCEGGGNEEENLVTSCVDCNLGKSGKPISQTAPTEGDRLRMAQEMQEQRIAADRARDSVAARSERRQVLINFWCELSGRDDVDTRTINTVFRYAQEFGEDVVFPWIEAAASKARSDQDMGRYISGIRRSILSAEGNA